MYHVYVLKSLRDGKLYTGFAVNLGERLQKHRDGKVFSTKNRLPVKLIYYEAYLSKTDALIQEKYLKSGGKAKKNLKTKLKNSLIT